MPSWIHRTLSAIVLLCCMVIGVRVYLEFNTPVPTAAPAEFIAQAPEQLPEFSLNDIWGEMHSISEWSGKPLLINFWATWCAPCRREMPLLQALHTEQNVTDLQVVGIAIDRLPDVQSYLAEAGISYPNLVGEADAIAVSDLFGLSGLGLPFSVLVTADGQILTVHIGELVAEQLIEMTAISRAVAAGELDTATARDRLKQL